MPEKKQKHEQGTTRNVKKLTLPDGFRVGIIDLDNILKQVADLGLSEEQTIKAELLERTKDLNYVPRSAEKEYSTALYQEYTRKFGGPGADQNEKPEVHKHTPG